MTSTAAGQGRRPRCRPRRSRLCPRGHWRSCDGAPVGPTSASVSVPRPSSSSGPAQSRRPSRVVLWCRPMVPGATSLSFKKSCGRRPARSSVAHSSTRSSSRPSAAPEELGLVCIVGPVAGWWGARPGSRWSSAVFTSRRACWAWAGASTSSSSGPSTPTISCFSATSHWILQVVLCPGVSPAWWDRRAGARPRESAAAPRGEPGGAQRASRPAPRERRERLVRVPGAY